MAADTNEWNEFYFELECIFKMPKANRSLVLQLTGKISVSIIRFEGFYCTKNCWCPPYNVSHGNNKLKNLKRKRKD
ncbi:hypothetical protein BLOT_001466 [Blomia tropicalis]|nr:hypothetical protein BLOT_001466 [Blomia tropicalis]